MLAALELTEAWLLYTIWSSRFVISASLSPSLSSVLITTSRAIDIAVVYASSLSHNDHDSVAVQLILRSRSTASSLRTGPLILRLSLFSLTAAVAGRVALQRSNSVIGMEPDKRLSSGVLFLPPKLSYFPSLALESGARDCFRAPSR